MSGVPPYTEEQIEYFREMGKKGGRKPTVLHSDGQGCRCANCRRARGERGSRLNLPRSKGIKSRVIDVKPVVVKGDE